MNLLIEKLNGIKFGFISNIAGNAVMFLTTILIARVFTKEEYGEFRYLFSIASIILLVFMAGRDSFIIYLCQKNGFKVDDVRGELYFGLFNLVLVTILLITFSQPIVSYILNDSVSQENFCLAILMIPLWGVFNLILSIIKSLGHINFYQILVNFYQRLLRAPVIFLCYLLYDTGVSLYAGMLFSQIALIAFAVRKCDFVLSIKKVKPKLYIKNFKYSLKLGLAAVSMVILSRTDALMLGYIVGNGHVATYDIAFLISSIVMIPFVALVKVNEVSMNVSIFNLAKYRKDLVAAFSICSVVSISSILYGENVLAFFGDQYSNSYAPLVLLSCGFYISTFFGSPAEILNMNGFAGYSMAAHLFVFSVNIGLNYFLIPLYFEVGAAIATVLSLILVRVICCFLCYVKSIPFSVVPPSFFAKSVVLFIFVFLVFVFFRSGFFSLYVMFLISSVLFLIFLLLAFLVVRQSDK